MTGDTRRILRWNLSPADALHLLALAAAVYALAVVDWVGGKLENYVDSTGGDA